MMIAALTGCVPLKERSLSQNTGISATYIKAPLIKGMSHNQAIRVGIYLPEGPGAVYQSLSLQLDENALRAVEKIDVYGMKSGDNNFSRDAKLLGSAPAATRGINVPISLSLSPGIYYLWVSPVLKAGSDIDQQVSIEARSLTTSNGKPVPVTNAGDKTGIHKRLASALRRANDDGVHTYRIPGIAATEKGTLISVYDIRYDHSGDLPANIDVGMNRSTDGGKTWEPMKIIMDMGGPKENSGVGDPAILFDPVTKRIWVAALWSKGNRSIAGSEPGLSPDVTGQFVLVSSDDDGKTWSKPYSITSQVKDPKWHLYFNGPGNGIAMENGTLVFPSQYWDESKKPGMPHSAIIYSNDHGKTWKSGTGAKSNTTESQVVETTPGTLMLNMRDNRGKYRSVATTKDLGMNWLEHHTSYQALLDPVCMGSIIKARVKVRGKMQDVLFFSNANSQTARKDITIKASLDLGETWLPANELLLDERLVYGYSALTRVDENTIGIIYEGQRDLYFMRIAVADIIK